MASLRLTERTEPNLDRAIDRAIATCDGDARAALRGLIVSNSHLEAELQALRDAVVAIATAVFQTAAPAGPGGPTR